MDNQSLVAQKSLIEETFALQRKHAQELKSSSAKDRVAKLTIIETYLLAPKNVDRLCNALYKDLRKSRTETVSAELGVVIGALRNIKKNLKDWMADKKVSTPLAFTGSTSYIRHEPKGTALIISPWNYPFQLAINPLIYAIAGGCTAMMKPSEFSSATSQFIEEMINELFDAKEVKVFQGEVETSSNLLALPFNHMYFTGSPSVGKIVMQSASKHLSSLTLELGGKSPCIIDKHVNIDKTAEKLVWGKLYNNGQTCIAPDHLYLHKEIKEPFINAIQKHIEKMYNHDGEGVESSADYGRIISPRHFDRAIDILNDANKKGAKIVLGGKYNKGERFIEPTLITNVTNDMTVMQEEIFNPILPVITFTKKKEVLDQILSRPKPLAMYIHSKKSEFQDYFLQETSAGSTVINDFLLQYANHNLPFGGVNNSGIGKTHSIHGFLEFTNQRSVFKQRFGVTNILFPPYGKKTEKLAMFLAKWLS